jgi:hypothetical protein
MIKSTYYKTMCEYKLQVFYSLPIFVSLYVDRRLKVLQVIENHSRLETYLYGMERTMT